MKIFVRSALLLFVLGIFCHRAIADAGPVQIVSVHNHSLSLEVDNLKRIFEKDELKNRYVSVVGIAGSSRKGKSFLLNFFLRYLYARYKAHNVTDWIGEHKNSSDLTGFVWRGGTKRETTGILMWSEIFTYDYDDGRKVAIILIDTQGTFDGKSSVEEYSKIFALSMMFSSLQCYNVMQNIKEDDLQNLDTFTVFGQLARQQTDETPLQKLFFIVRDWRFPRNNAFGLAPQFTKKILDGNKDQTQDMLELRNRIKTSFSNITAFLMPHPGSKVASGKAKNVKDMTPRFIKYLNELAPAIFAPENLVIKQMNGRMIQTENLIDLIETSFKTLASDSVPSPKSILSIVSEMENRMLSADCLQLYTSLMNKSLNGGDPFLKPIEFQKLHQNSKEVALLKFSNKRKLGGDDAALTFRKQLEGKIETEFYRFSRENDMKRDVQVELVNMRNEKLKESTQLAFENRILAELSLESAPSHSGLYRIFFDVKNETLQNYTAQKEEITGFTVDLNGDLVQHLDDYLIKLIDALNEYNVAFKYYSKSMQKALVESGTYVVDFANRHLRLKESAIEMFFNKVVPNRFKTILEGHLDNDIDARSKFYSGLNDIRKKKDIERKEGVERQKEAERKQQEEQEKLKTIADDAKPPYENAYEKIIDKFENTIDNYKNAVLRSKQWDMINQVFAAKLAALQEIEDKARDDPKRSSNSTRFKNKINSLYSHLTEWYKTMIRIF